MGWWRDGDVWDRVTAVLLLAFAALIVLTFRNYGVSWDQEFSQTHGRHFLNWYSSGFRDSTVVSAPNNEYLYGSFFNAVVTLAADHSPFGTYETVDLITAVFGFFGILYAYRLGKLLAGSMGGFLSAAILLLTPAYYGHSFINHRDLPFAALFLVALFYVVRAYDQLPRLSGRAVTAAGVAIGLTLGIRVGGVLLLAYLGLLTAIWLLVRYRTSRLAGGAAIWPDVGRAALSFLLVGAVSWAVMLVWWPYAQLDPIRNPLRALAESANFTKWHWTVLYRGEYIPSDSLPWHYLPVSFLVTLPEFYVIALVAGLVVLVIVGLRGRQKAGAAPLRDAPDHRWNVHTASKVAFLVFVAFFPLITAIATRPVLYDVHRHFLFVIPPFAVLSGVALAWLLQRVLPRAAKVALAAVVLAVAGITVSDMIRLHPYEYAFYNRSTGGLRGANGRYETEYWGVSYREGMEWLIANYRLDAPPASIRVANTSNPFLTAYYLGPSHPESRRFVQAGLGDSPHVVLSITRWNQHLGYPGPLLHVVERMGTPLLYVIETAR